jgi:hypothetical protein
MRDGLGEVAASRLDGNAAAGLLSEIFAGDVTAARATCVGCGTTDNVGALLLYAHEMGAVLRCPGCGSVVLRVVRTPRQLWLDATGSKAIVIDVSPGH